MAKKSHLRKGPRGWLETVVEFIKYAAFIAWKLGDLVDTWATLNEPIIIAEIGYMIPESGFPLSVRNLSAFKKATMNLILAHARAYDVIREWDTIKADEDSKGPAQVGVIHNLIPI